MPSAVAIQCLTPSHQQGAARAVDLSMTLFHKQGVPAGAVVTASLVQQALQGKATLAAQEQAVLTTQPVAVVALTQRVLLVLVLLAAQAAQGQRPQLQAAASHELAVVVAEQHSKALPEGWAVQAVVVMGQLERE